MPRERVSFPMPPSLRAIDVNVAARGPNRHAGSDSEWLLVRLIARASLWT